MKSSRNREICVVIVCTLLSISLLGSTLQTNTTTEKSTSVRKKVDRPQRTVDPNQLEAYFVERVHFLPDEAWERVVKEANRYLQRQHFGTGLLYHRSRYWLPLLQDVCKTQGLPLKLAFVPVVESAFQLDAVSPAGAAGLWQFTAPTARRMKLQVNEYVDQRFDPEPSTVAALEYLKLLHKDLGDWECALAAYNAGQGSINRAHRKSGQKNYWKLKNHLPAETNKYIPRLLALMYLFDNAEQFGLNSYCKKKNKMTVSVAIDESLAKFSRKFSVSRRIIEKYNPDLKGKYSLNKWSRGLLILPWEEWKRIENMNSNSRTPQLSFIDELSVMGIEEEIAS